MSVATASSFYVEQVRKVTVLCFTTRGLTEKNYEFIADDLFEFVSLVTSERPIRVVAEMASVNQIDDLGLAMLKAFNDSIHDADGTLILCRVQTPVMTEIVNAGLKNDFTFRDTRGEAMWSF